METYQGVLSICVKVGKSMQRCFFEDSRFYRTPYVGPARVGIAAREYQIGLERDWRTGARQLRTGEREEEAQVSSRAGKPAHCHHKHAGQRGAGRREDHVGLQASSTAVISDGLESAGDVLASGLVLLGLVFGGASLADARASLRAWASGDAERAGGGDAAGDFRILISPRSLERSGESHHAPAAYAIWPLVGFHHIKAVMSASKRRYARKIAAPR